MEVKTYRASTLQAALRLVQRELGPDAAVLETKRIWDSTFGRMFGLSQVEVVASKDVYIPSRFAQSAKSPSLDVGIELSDIPLESPEEPSPDSSHSIEQSLEQKVASLRESTLGTERFSAEEIRLCTELIEVDVDRKLASDLVRNSIRQSGPIVGPEQLADSRSFVRDQIAAGIQIQGEIRIPHRTAEQGGRVVALVGPTGVGKTTTIAKLAANFRLRDKRRVGLITVDTYRIAAVEQLKTYADIIDLPMEVVSSDRELRAAMARLSHLDLILMDTAGRSPQNTAELDELKSILDQAQPHEVHLVLSVTASTQSLIKTADRFSKVGTTSLLLTKLDESLGLGNLIPVWQKVPLPLSYVTNGQNVPDDIRIAQSDWLAEQIVPIHEGRSFEFEGSLR